MFTCGHSHFHIFNGFCESPHVRTNTLYRFVSILLWPLFWRFKSYACLIIKIRLLLFLDFLILFFFFFKWSLVILSIFPFRALLGTCLKVYVELLQLQDAVKSTLWGHTGYSWRSSFCRLFSPGFSETVSLTRTALESSLSTAADHLMQIIKIFCNISKKYLEKNNSFPSSLENIAKSTQKGNRFLVKSWDQQILTIHSSSHITILNEEILIFAKPVHSELP